MKKRESESDFREWIRRAEEDYETARAMARKRARPVPNVVGFHCQQCVEKYLKALLVHRRVSFPKTHDLVDLLELCLPHMPVLEIFRRDFEGITGFAVQFRYPGEDATKEEAKAALRITAKVREYLRNVLRKRR